jgi:hypothetical protein
LHGDARRPRRGIGLHGRILGARADQVQTPCRAAPSRLSWDPRRRGRQISSTFVAEGRTVVRRLQGARRYRTRSALDDSDRSAPSERERPDQGAPGSSGWLEPRSRVPIPL